MDACPHAARRQPLATAYALRCRAAQNQGLVQPASLVIARRTGTLRRDLRTFRGARSIKMKFRSSARSFGLGRAAYWLWHAPAAAVKKSIAAGGPLEQFRDDRAHAGMTHAAAQLTPQSHPPAKDWPELHFLTGKKFWDQTAFCLQTFQAQAGRAAQAVFHDDGSADEATRAQLTRLFPAAHWRRTAEIEAGLDTVLPAAKFPVLRERRAHYPNLRKLTDVHAGAHGWRLVLDSDMLFFRRP